jgi:hypothetical protein
VASARTTTPSWPSPTRRLCRQPQIALRPTRSASGSSTGH